MKECKNEFEVRDCLGGYLTGNYEKDHKRAEKHGTTFSEELYEEAYQNDQQP
jgi:hypothetical protein